MSLSFFFLKCKLPVLVGYSLKSFIIKQVLFSYESCLHACVTAYSKVKLSWLRINDLNKVLSVIKTNQSLVFNAYLLPIWICVAIYRLLQHSLPSYRIDGMQYAGTFHPHTVLWQTGDGITVYVTVCRKSWYSACGQCGRYVVGELEKATTYLYNLDFKMFLFATLKFQINLIRIPTEKAPATYRDEITELNTQCSTVEPSKTQFQSMHYKHRVQHQGHSVCGWPF